MHPARKGCTMDPWFHLLSSYCKGLPVKCNLFSLCSLAHGWASHWWHSVCQWPSSLWLASSRWPCGLKESTAATSKSSETTHLSALPSCHLFCRPLYTPPHPKLTPPEFCFIFLSATLELINDYSLMISVMPPFFHVSNVSFLSLSAFGHLIKSGWLLLLGLVLTGVILLPIIYWDSKE